jgi:glycosyltransferase involved in cell wall biosynthesis
MIPLIIPSYEPDERLVSLIKDLTNEKYADLSPIIIVNDGSTDEKYIRLFNEVARISDRVVLLSHEINKGKGAALKTAFRYVCEELQDVIGVVTADSDGQHTPDCILKVSNALCEYKDRLILGIRDFEGGNIPWKSKFGNNLTIKVFSYISGLHVNDTQTGLRGIPYQFLQKCLEIKYDRFEYEMQMLLETIGVCDIHEVKIETVYDSAEEHQTHFNPVLDSIKIYSVLGKRFTSFIISSCSSCIIDVGIFTLLCCVLKEKGFNNSMYVFVATVCARIVSAIYNYIINYKLVFNSKEKHIKSVFKYAPLVIVQMMCSAIIVTMIVALLHNRFETLIKLVVDTLLFFASYYVQQMFVFRKKHEITD